ncbi:ligand-dependent nuclear receptor-interacting factor 1-like [Narcine bancroftii]|uniref:ligand-dependent nuclear receptor-interacting factor 1-like n=1 Tax=Narcine bancroftii TaxID=1343680 RepID=UPI0038311065
MSQSQLSHEPQSALTPKPCSLASGCEQVHSSVASPASGLAAGPSPATNFGMVQNVASPGTYIQIPINAEVYCVSTFSLPMAVRKKIYGVTYNVPKANDSKPTTAIYICPVNTVKLIETKNLLPLAHKPTSLVCGAKSMTGLEKPISSPTPKVPSKEISLRRQDTKMNCARKESAITPTPVSVKFCSNLASQVLKTFVRQPGKGGSMDSLIKTYFSSPLEMKTANSFKDNALLLFNGQLFFLAHKGTEIPTGADKGKLSEKELGTQEVKMVPGEPDGFQSRIDAGHTLASSLVAKLDIDSCETKCNLETNRKECAVLRDASLNTPTDTSAITQQNGSELAQQIVKHLPNVSGSRARRPMFPEYKDLLLKAGIHSDVSVCLYRISMNGDADTSGRWLECPTRCIPQLCKEPDPVNLEECPKLSREPELAKPEGCLDSTWEGDPDELKECPKLSREVDLGESEENLNNARVPASFLSQKCPELSKESEPVGMEEWAAKSIRFKPVELEECPSISKESSPVTLAECHGHSKNNVTVALQEDGDPCKIPGLTGFREHLEPTVNSADLKDCLLESEEGCQNKGKRKRKEVEIENPSSAWPNPSWDDDVSEPHKRRKDHKEISLSETSADSQREKPGFLSVGGPSRVETEQSGPTLLYNLLESNKEQSKLPSQAEFHPGQHKNPLEVDETIRDEKINRLKEALKEKQEALDRMRKKVAPSYSASCSTLEPL